MNVQASLARLFWIAAVYDGVLGLIFLFGGGRILRWFDLEPPNHPGYLQFPAALLLVFALMFTSIARNPRANRHLIPYGMLLKASYCGVVLFHWLGTGLPWIWKPFWFLDLLFLALFAISWWMLRNPTAQAE